MALIFKNMPCSLCGEPIDTDASFFASSAAADEENHCLLEHSDSAIHWPCLFAWNGVDRFLEIIYRNHQQFFKGNEYWRIVHQDDRYSIAVNYEKAAIDINHTPCNPHIMIADYPDALIALKHGDPTNYYDSERLGLLRATIDEIVATYPRLETFGDVPEIVRRIYGSSEQGAPPKP